MSAKLTPGMSTAVPSHGERPAAAERRTLIASAIQINGTLHTNKTHPSHSGAPCSTRSHFVSDGLTKSIGVRWRPVVARITDASTAYLRNANTIPLTRYSRRWTKPWSPHTARNQRITLIAAFFTRMATVLFVVFSDEVPQLHERVDLTHNDPRVRCNHSAPTSTDRPTHGRHRHLSGGKSHQAFQTPAAAPCSRRARP